LVDMVHLKIALHMAVIRGLTEIEGSIIDRLDMPIEENRKASWINFLAMAMDLCGQSHLRVLSNLLQSYHNAATARPLSPITNRDIQRGACSIRDALEAEFFESIVLLVPDADAHFYKAPQPFGEEVSSHFPSAAHDISEAAKCLALDRSTACVLHLMRALEVGLNVLAEEMQIPFKYMQWEQIINKIPGRIEEIEKDLQKPSDWRESRRFYAEAGVQFDFIKDAFRNHAMHAHKTYGLSVARDIYQSTKVFMMHLSARLREKAQG
jgi:hypothetical protein